MNKVILKGRLVADPELRQTQSGVSVCSFKVAVDKYSKDKDKKEADFIDCDAWRGTADMVAKYFSKGKEILAEGAIHNHNYEKSDGTKVYTYKVTVDRVEFCGTKGDSGASSGDGSETINPADFEEILSDGDVPF